MLGGFHFFSKTINFCSLCFYVKIGSVFYFKKYRGLQESFWISIFFLGKKIQFSSLAILSNSRTTSFLGRFSQARSQNFQYFYGKLFFKCFFWQKGRLWIYFQRYINPQFLLFQKLFQIVLTSLLGLHLSQ